MKKKKIAVVFVFISIFLVSYTTLSSLDSEIKTDEIYLKGYYVLKINIKNKPTKVWIVPIDQNCINIFPKDKATGKGEILFLIWPKFFNRFMVCKYAVFVNNTLYKKLIIYINSTNLEDLRPIIQREKYALNIIYPDKDFYVITDFNISGKDINNIYFPDKEGHYRIAICKENRCYMYGTYVEKNTKVKIYNFSVTKNESDISVKFCIMNVGDKGEIEYLVIYDKDVFTDKQIVDKNKSICKEIKFGVKEGEREIKIIAKGKENIDIISKNVYCQNKYTQEKYKNFSKYIEKIITTLILKILHIFLPS